MNASAPVFASKRNALMPPRWPAGPLSPGNSLTAYTVRPSRLGNRYDGLTVFVDDTGATLPVFVSKRYT
ncbi:hypothetical protein BGV69_06075 [Burkholderia ubonensis]|nr:hypothetical protein BGV69_06075 [Burkholderia ubonensis]